MSSKRLLDAAKLLDAGSSIARQHINIRRQQWDAYSKTSTLVRAVKHQTDRVTVTFSAAAEIAKRLNEDAAPIRERVDEARQQVQQTIIRTNGTNSGHEGRDPTTLDAHATTSQPPKQYFDGHDALRSTSNSAQTEVNQDVFYERPENESSPVQLRSDTTIPAHGKELQNTEHVGTVNLNQDVFYSRPVSEVVEEKSDGSHMDVHSSPSISKMLGTNVSDRKNPYTGRKKLPPTPLPEMMAAEKRWKEAKDSSISSSQGTAKGDEQADTENLAASIAENVQSEIPNTSESVPEQRNNMHESKVPSTRFGRIWQYSGLATGMAFGALNEGFRRFTGGPSGGSLMLSEANMNRLVAKLSRMRGAALKLGQMISFQDSKVLPPTINAVLQRVQDSADYMPAYQRDQVLTRNLGQNWRDLFLEFEEKPFAAASIGQVHKATLASNEQRVAVKIQYPGVRNSIDSDLNNLSLLLTASRLLPKGLYLDKTIANARKELGWECDYEREAAAGVRFGQLVQDESHTFAVPTVYPEASGADVLTAEFLDGTAVTKIADLTQKERDWIGTQILRLCLRELMEWRFMQTDPNWTNFLYNRRTKKLELLDFGASRDFPDSFIEPYVSLLIAASKGDRDRCRELSIELGYLTGRESNAMLKAHVDSILTLAEPFVEDAPTIYDFDGQTITDRVRANVGLMLNERLAPPPEETYSLHRKLSGAFLLCARLKSQVAAREMFQNAVRVWEGKARKVETPVLE